jgi:hypothetical protein
MEVKVSNKWVSNTKEINALGVVRERKPACSISR